MTSSQSASAMEQGNLTEQTIGRPVVYGTQGVISSGHYLTSMAGMRMLLTGGNAFDALVAAGFAAAVTEPIAAYSLAAEGVFMLYDAASDEMLSLSGQGVAPGLATADPAAADRNGGHPQRVLPPASPGRRAQHA